MRLAFLALMLPTSAFAGPLVTDTFSGTTDDNTGQDAYKLNTYTIGGGAVQLVDFSAWLEPQENASEVRFVVYQLTGTSFFGTDEWDLIWDSGSQVLPGGLGFKTSPPVNLDLIPGESYAIGVYLENDDVDYYWADPGDEVVSWGVRYGSLYAENGLAWWLPATITADPTDHGYHQEVTVEIYEDLDLDGVDERTDCDDTDPLVHPGANEMCNLVDDDCDGAVDDNVVYVDWFADTDADGFGDAGDVQNTCDGPPAGYVANPDDCNDGDVATFPGATEVCDGADQDCDGMPDDGLPTTTWFVDADADGWGDGDQPLQTCDTTAPAGYAEDPRDCDDEVDTVYPEAPELCDGLDNDCNDLVDDDVVYTDYFADRDGDGYGDPGEVLNTCEGQPSGYVTDATDCNDAVSSVFPGAPELCDGLDNDCANGPEADELDSDTDGALDCADCAPDDPEIYPGAEDPCNGVDNDCDGFAPVESDCDPFVGERLVAGCGCRAAPAPSAGYLLLLGLLALRRRR